MAWRRAVVGLPRTLIWAAEGLVGEPADDVGEGGDRGQQGHRPRLAEAQAGRPLAVVGGGQHDGLQGGGVGQAGLALAEGGQEPGVGGGADPAQGAASCRR